MRCRNPIRTPGLVAALLVALAGVRPLGAETVAPSQVTAPTYQPPPPARTTAWDDDIPIYVEPSRPRGSERLRIRVRGVGIRGGFRELADADMRALRKLAGRRARVAEIFAVAAALQQNYVHAGYWLARVGVASRRPADHGAVSLVVTDGFIESLDLDGVAASQRERVRERLAEIVGRRHVRRSEIEQALSSAADVPGLALHGALARGDAAGAAKLVVTGERNAVSGAISFDNRLPAALGGAEAIATVAVNDASGQGEQVFASAGASPSLSFEGPPRFGVFDVGVSAPFAVEGLRLTPEYTHAQSRLATAAGASASAAFDRVVIRGAYDLERDGGRGAQLGGELGAIVQTENAAASDSASWRDAYGFARARVRVHGVAAGGEPVSADLELSQGLAGRGATTLSGPPLSRSGASPQFHKAAAGLRLSQSLSEALRVDFIARGQWSFGRPLFVSEQFALDGADALSPFPGGALSVDSGATLRAELTRSLTAVPGAVPSRWSPYLFAAGGAGRLEAPAPLEIGALRAFAFGFGIRSQLDLGAGRSAFAAAEIGREYANEPGAAAGYRVSLTLASAF